MKSPAMILVTMGFITMTLTSLASTLEELEGQYETSKLTLNLKFARAVEKYKDNYTEGLDALDNHLSGKADLKGVLAVRKEKERYTQSGKIPLKQDRSLHPSIVSLQSAFAGAHDAAAQKRNEIHIRILRQYGSALTALQKRLTVERKIEQAQEVQAKIRSVSRDISELQIACPKLVQKGGRLSPVVHTLSPSLMVSMSHYDPFGPSPGIGRKTQLFRTYLEDQNLTAPPMKYLEVDSKNGRILTERNSPIVGRMPFALSILVNSNGVKDFHLINQMNGYLGHVPGWEIFWPGGTEGLEYSEIGPRSAPSCKSTSPLLENKWVHVLVNRHAERIQFYVNGVLTEREVRVPGFRTQRLTIAGRYYKGVSKTYDIKVAQLMIFDRPLSEPEVEELSKYINSLNYIE